MSKTIYSIVVTDYIEHNMGTMKKVSIPYATEDMNKAKEVFDSIILEKLEKLGYEFEECEFDTDFDAVIHFKMREVVEVEDDWFDVEIVTTKLV